MLQLDPVSIVDANGERYSLAEAAALGLVEPRTAKHILKALEPHALQKYIDRQEIDPQTGDYVDIKNREVCTVSPQNMGIFFRQASESTDFQAKLQRFSKSGSGQGDIPRSKSGETCRLFRA